MASNKRNSKDLGPLVTYYTADNLPMSRSTRASDNYVSLEDRIFGEIVTQGRSIAVVSNTN
jgi:hypothetical protein